MRNTTEYPITKREILETLKRVAKEVAARNEALVLVGDMTPLVLEEAARRIRGLRNDVSDDESETDF